MALFYGHSRSDSVSLKSFSFLAMSKTSRLRFRQFVAWNIHTAVFFVFLFTSFFFFVFLLIFTYSLQFLVAVISLFLLF